MKKLDFRKMAAGLLALILAAASSGCATQESAPPGGDDGKMKIVCTIFPEYDWTRELLGALSGKTDITLLLKNGSDLHSYQPTVWDMVEISEADLFIYVGGESDFWVENALANAKNPNRRTLNLMEVLEDSVKEEEHVEGMRSERGHAHGEEAHGEEDEAHSHGEEEPEYDEHVWLSLRNAEKICGAIAEELSLLDEENRMSYEQNCADYLEKLQALDREYAKVTEQASVPVLLFGDRFPFRYLAEDYGLSYYAAFSGCSAETEASFETITFLAGRMDELKLPAVLTIDGSDGKIARTVAGNTKTRDQKVLTLDSMQSVSEQDLKDGENYLSVMEKNLEVLKEALPGT